MEDLQKLLHGICLHPRVYTPHGDFCEAIAFISGFVAGRCPDVVNYQESELFSFGIWMANRFDVIARNWLWWSVLLHAFGNDEDQALRGLPALYDEFVAEARNPR